MTELAGVGGLDGLQSTATVRGLLTRERGDRKEEAVAAVPGERDGGEELGHGAPTIMIAAPLFHGGAQESVMALDPQVQAVIDLVIKSGRPAYHQLSPKDARQLFRDTRPAATPTPPEIGTVTNLLADGKIPVRVYRPVGAPADRALPALVFFHGGGWVIGDLETHDVLCRQLTAEAGVTVIAVDYRLAPEAKFPAAADDAWAGHEVGRRQRRPARRRCRAGSPSVATARAATSPRSSRCSRAMPARRPSPTRCSSIPSRTSAPRRARIGPSPRGTC